MLGWRFRHSPLSRVSLIVLDGVAFGWRRARNSDWTIAGRQAAALVQLLHLQLWLKRPNRHLAKRHETLAQALRMLRE